MCIGPSSFLTLSCAGSWAVKIYVLSICFCSNVEFYKSSVGFAHLILRKDCTLLSELSDFMSLQRVWCLLFLEDKWMLWVPHEDKHERNHQEFLRPLVLCSASFQPVQPFPSDCCLKSDVGNICFSAIPAHCVSPLLLKSVTSVGSLSAHFLEEIAQIGCLVHWCVWRGGLLSPGGCDGQFEQVLVELEGVSNQPGPWGSNRPVVEWNPQKVKHRLNLKDKVASGWDKDRQKGERWGLGYRMKCSFSLIPDEFFSIADVWCQSSCLKKKKKKHFLVCFKPGLKWALSQVKGKNLPLWKQTFLRLCKNKNQTSVD